MRGNEWPGEGWGSQPPSPRTNMWGPDFEIENISIFHRLNADPWIWGDIHGKVHSTSIYLPMMRWVEQHHHRYLLLWISIPSMDVINPRVPCNNDPTTTSNPLSDVAAQRTFIGLLRRDQSKQSHLGVG